MIIYNVTIAIDSTVESEWLSWIRAVHVPDVLRTGCFVEAIICKVIDEATHQPMYVIEYRCSSIRDYHRYRDDFADAIQKEHSDRFSGRFQAARQILEEVWRGP
jgi:hypothetical protein